jgi:hypothetical protein
MKKFIPVELQTHILPFNWNLKLVWGLSTPVQKVFREKFDYLLELPLWSSIPNSGMLFDISPIEVLKNPSRFSHQYIRILQSDTAFPIELIEHNNRIWILDGVHRLAKMFLWEKQFINVRIHPNDVVSNIKQILDYP